MLHDKINNIIDKSSSSILELKKNTNEIEKAINVLIKCLENGNKIIIFGNGGSAADAQHLAAEFVGRYKYERNSLPAISLTTDTSIITAIGNDYGFEHIFSRQCESIVQKNDVIIAITTSGKSQNILNAIKTCRTKNAIIIGMTGENGKNLQELVDILLVVSSKDTPRIQEAHKVIMHTLCEIIDEHYNDIKK